MWLLSPTQKAWLAGFVDGEGYLGILFQRKKENSQQSASPLYHPYLIVTNTDRNSIFYIREILGEGRIYEFDRKNYGFSPSLQYKLTKREALKRLLVEIKPFLRVKYKQAELLLKFLETRERRKIVTGGGSRGKTSFSKEEEEIYQELLRLNKRGLER